ncbi:MAG: hypothetical protein ACRDYZ_16240 [Acidimicrobiales bacterium]
MGTLQHVLESRGLATVGLSSMRGQTERLHPPRALYCEFPLGRPLGRPNDPVFQHRVLAAAFALLDEPKGPVLADFGERIADSSAEPLACTVPLADAPGQLPAVAEALGLRPAYERTLTRIGRTNVGRTVGGPEGVPDLLERLARVADDGDWRAAQFPGDDAVGAVTDVRAYFEEAALSLVDHVPEARQSDGWFFTRTEAGRLVRAAQQAVRATGAPQPEWFYLVPQIFQ